MRIFRVVYKNHTGVFKNLVRETKYYWFLSNDVSSYVYKIHKKTFNTKIIRVENIDFVNGKYDIYGYPFERVKPIIVEEI